ncbi:MAG: anaerobic sulfite reductase subunit AsrA [Eubacteriales bacterium]|nr:anaerobic sulfite reductase subunit AsrA [Eubacteriales bacterium]
MGFEIGKEQFNQLLASLSKDYDVYAPKVFVGGGRFSDTDVVRYDKVTEIDEVEFDKKSAYSFKEVLTPISQTLFYFTENETKVPDEAKKGAVIFLRSCDLHGLKRLDDMYENNGPADFYYERIRSRIKVVLMGCGSTCESGFCVSMGTNKADQYDLCVNARGDHYEVEVKDELFAELLNQAAKTACDVTPDFVTENKVTVSIPENLDATVAKSKMWEEYNKRCANCGRCNFVCPTCTCFTMQDLFYDENGKVGERRRVWASCMVDGYTDVAGGGSYRRVNGERMRFKTLHKVLDYKERNGYHMCVGCGRCDDICPEYISFSHIINRLGDAMKEVSE